MKIAVLGTGMVGETIGSKLVALGHEVKMGSRSANNEKAAAWVKKSGAKASQGTFADAAAFGELIAAGKENLKGKLLLDLSNPLDFSKGMPPTLFVSNTDSLGEQIQRAFPELKVVKTLNTISANVMVDPARIPGEHAVFVSGNDADAKAQVKRLLTEWFGWKQILDLGDITTSRGTESYLPLWLRLWGAVGTPDFNIQIVKKA
jgi:hypothetical protein